MLRVRKKNEKKFTFQNCNNQSVSDPVELLELPYGLYSGWRSGIAFWPALRAWYIISSYVPPLLANFGKLIFRIATNWNKLSGFFRSYTPAHDPASRSSTSEPRFAKCGISMLWSQISLNLTIWSRRSKRTWKKLSHILLDVVHPNKYINLRRPR